MKKFLVILAALGLFLAACGGDDNESSDDDGSGAVDPGTETPDDGSSGDGGDGTDVASGGITISGFEYQVPDDVKVGDSVEVTNDDGAPHTFTLTDGSVGTSTLSGGDSESVTFDAAGTFDIICEIHSSMSGSITVAS